MVEIEQRYPILFLVPIEQPNVGIRTLDTQRQTTAYRHKERVE